jgi:ectoine hydroxylase-related dioxygenase (phytanoyl-CoA dioxygenase family)
MSPLPSLTATRIPAPTRDLEQIARDLAECGYGVLLDALGRAEVAGLRARLFEQADTEAAAGMGWFDAGAASGAGPVPAARRGPNQRVWMLINKGQAFRDLVLKPVIRTLLAPLLGEPFLLSSLTANIARRGGAPMALHSDQGYIPDPSAYPMVANIAWMLGECREDNGATRVVPGSHLGRRPAGAEFQETPSVAAEGPAGSALVFDGRLWHGTGANRTDEPRAVVLSYFCRPFIRPQENATLSILPEVYASAPDELRALLGFKLYHLLGGVQGPAAGAWVHPQSDLIGELHP